MLRNYLLEKAWRILQLAFGAEELSGVLLHGVSHPIVTLTIFAVFVATCIPGQSELGTLMSTVIKMLNSVL